VPVDLFPPWHASLERPFCVTKTMGHEVSNGESLSIVVSHTCNAVNKVFCRAKKHHADW
jgi:hypothetical protein